MSRLLGPRTLVTATLLLALVAGSAGAASTSFWLTDSFALMRAGRLDGTSVLNDGSIVLGPSFERHEVDGAQYVWSAARGRGGTVYAVSGTPGRLQRLDGGGWTTLAEDETSDYSSLAVSPGGDIFVGTAPGGAVRRVTGAGDSELFFDTGQGYVWGMAYWEGHGLVVATGDSARVFLVDGDGDGSEVYRSDDASVTATAVVEGRILVGTSPDGVLLDVTPGRGPRVLFDSHYEEISGIASDTAGRILFAGTTVSFDQVFAAGDEFGEGFGDGSVYALTDAGGAVEVWYSEDAPITALGRGVDGAVWVGTGLRGRVHALDASGGVDVVAELQDDQVLSIGTAQGVGLVSSGLSAAVYLADGHGSGNGAYESDVFDARAAAVWGELTWTSEAPPGASVRLFTRSGNTEKPDGTWSEWSEVVGDGEGAVGSPPGRRLQWKAELSAGRGASPVLRGVEVAYVRENLPPRVVSVTVYEPGDVKTNGGAPGSASQTLPSGVEITYSVPSQDSEGALVPEMLRGIRTAEWTAIDPNGDVLEFDVWIRSEEETEWKLVAGAVDRAVYTWDSASMPDGRYHVRVVADDRKGNLPGPGSTGEAESGPFVVDNTPPVFEDLDVSGRGDVVNVSGGAGDAWSQITRVQVAVDYGDWMEARASDGSFDSRMEAFTAEVEPGDRGSEHALAVRAVDRAGNVAVLRKVLR